MIIRYLMCLNQKQSTSEFCPLRQKLCMGIIFSFIFISSFVTCGFTEESFDVGDTGFNLRIAEDYFVFVYDDEAFLVSPKIDTVFRIIFKPNNLSQSPESLIFGPYKSYVVKTKLDLQSLNKIGGFYYELTYPYSNEHGMIVGKIEGNDNIEILFAGHFANQKARSDVLSILLSLNISNVERPLSKRNNSKDIAKKIRESADRENKITYDIPTFADPCPTCKSLGYSTSKRDPLPYICLKCQGIGAIKRIKMKEKICPACKGTGENRQRGGNCIVCNEYNRSRTKDKYTVPENVIPHFACNSMGCAGCDKKGFTLEKETKKNSKKIKVNSVLVDFLDTYIKKSNSENPKEPIDEPKPEITLITITDWWYACIIIDRYKYDKDNPISKLFNKLSPEVQNILIDMAMQPEGSKLGQERQDIMNNSFQRSYEALSEDERKSVGKSILKE